MVGIIVCGMFIVETIYMGSYLCITSWTSMHLTHTHTHKKKVNVTNDHLVRAKIQPDKGNHSYAFHDSINIRIHFGPNPPLHN